MHKPRIIIGIKGTEASTVEVPSRHVTRPPARIANKATVLLGFVAVAGAAWARATPPPPKLQQETVEAFDRYVGLTEARNTAELEHGSGLLYVDALPKEECEKAYAGLRRGEVEMRRLQTLDSGAQIRAPGGMIHHWIGAAFIPGAKLAEVLAVLQDYNHHVEYYAPDVEQSHVESRDGDRFRVFMRFRRHKVITVVLDTEQAIQYFRDSPERAHSRSSAARIAQVQNAGKNNERELPPGDDDGFLWRMETWWRMIESDGGVYVQSEVVSLTRSIPTGLGWMIGPFVTSIPEESLTFTLEATRKAVEARARN